jgi:hypothetical protein
MLKRELWRTYGLFLKFWVPGWESRMREIPAVYILVGRHITEEVRSVRGISETRDLVSYGDGWTHFLRGW